MHNRFIILGTALFSLPLFLLSCTGQRGKGTCTVSGRLVLNCNSSPAKARSLIVEWKSDNSISNENDFNAGQATSDSDGNFAIDISDYVSGSLTVYEPRGPNGRHNWVENYEVGTLSAAGSDVAFGSLFESASYLAKIKVVVNSNQNANETIYVGSTSGKFSILPGAASGTYYLEMGYTSFDYQASSRAVHDMFVKWGIGKEEYLTAFNHPPTPDFHKVDCNFGRCGVVDTTLVSIP